MDAKRNNRRTRISEAAPSPREHVEVALQTAASVVLADGKSKRSSARANEVAREDGFVEALIGLRGAVSRNVDLEF